MSDGHDEDLHDGFVGVSRADLEAMPDSELAQWQHNHRNEPPLVTLAEREWQRRIISHQLKEQYDLNARLAKAAEDHAERIAESNRWWGIAGAVVGVIGTLAGVWLGKQLESPSPQASVQTQTQTSPPASAQQTAPTNTATSVASPTSPQSAKKPK